MECILQQGNTYMSSDVVNIKDIHRKFGKKPMNSLRFLSTFQSYMDVYLRGIESPCPLNFIDYNRERAFQELYDFSGFEYYGRKHLENILTAFIQLYWLPKKFGVDKRTSHLSSMIVSGQMTREEALREYEKPLYEEKMMRDYIAIIKDRLRMTDLEFDDIMKAPTHQHTEYSTESFYKCLKGVAMLKSRLSKKR